MEQGLKGGKHLVPANTSEEEGAVVCGFGYSFLVRGKQEGTKSNQSRGQARGSHFQGSCPSPWLLPQTGKWRVPRRTYSGENGPKNPYQEFPLTV